VQRSLDLAAAIARLRAEISGDDAQWPAEMLEKNQDVVQRHLDLLAGRRRQDKAERNTLEAQRDLRVQELAEHKAKKQAVENALTLAIRQRNLVRPLLATRSYSEVEYLNLEQRVSALQGDLVTLEAGISKSEAAMREAEERLILRKAELDSRNLAEINRSEVELAGLRELITSGGDRVTRTELRAPVRAVVKRIHIMTVGGVIKPGEVVMDLVPLDDTLLVEARVSPQDIAFIHPGKRAIIRLTAYDFTIFGALDAVVEHVGADTIAGEARDLFYPVKLRTTESSLRHKDELLPILPGMVASVDIITGNKTVLDYLLKPIIKAKQTALRER
jgi:adhesin transport system membrane fusion protein